MLSFCLSFIQPMLRKTIACLIVLYRSIPSDNLGSCALTADKRWNLDPWAQAISHSRPKALLSRLFSLIALGSTHLIIQSLEEKGLEDGSSQTHIFFPSIARLGQTNTRVTTHPEIIPTRSRARKGRGEDSFLSTLCTPLS